MYKFVLDADAAIKLAKAGVLERVTSYARCLIPRQVYDEIAKGKEKKREDAFAIELLVLYEKIKVVDVGMDDELRSLGAGEKAALATFRSYKVETIVSDDRKFLAKLEAENIPFTTPANLIALLVMDKKLTVEKGLQALNKIKNSIRDEVYKKAKEAIGGIQK